MSKISELSDGGAIQSGDTLIAVRSGGNVKVTYGGTTTANIDGGTIDGTVIGGSSAAAGSFTTISASGEIAANGGVAFGDNDKATFGASDDLQIYHTGSHSYIQDSGTGDLYIATNGNKVILRNTTLGESFFEGTSDGDVKIYYNGLEKLATTATGIDVTGTVEADTAHFGTGTGTGIAIADEVVVSGTGSTGITIHSPDANNATLAFGSATDNDYAFVQGYYNSGSPFLRFSIENSEKVKVSSTGIDVTGTVTADGLSVGSAGVNGSFYSVESIYVNIDSNNDSTSRVFQIGRNTTGNGEKLAVFAENGDISFYSSDGLSQALFWDASAESLGIGTTSPAQKFVVSDNGGAGLEFIPSTTNDRTALLSYDRNTSTYQTFQVDGSDHRFFTSGSEKARIDSSGNLLVGKTAGSVSTAGHDLYADGLAYHVRNGGICSVLNRLTSDGDIAVFRKDGTTVGSIGSTTSLGVRKPYFVGGGTQGITFGNTSLLPATSSGAADTGNTMDIGASGYKFKDLYLSGGVYLGGTGAANLLDDYEEGVLQVTLSPSTSGTITLDAASDDLAYTKVGRQVTITGWLIVASVSLPVGSSITFSLPFTVANLSNTSGGFGGMVAQNTSGSYVPTVVEANESATTGTINLNASTVTAGHRFKFSFTYFTS